jgi:hypothetical protein
MQFGATWRKSLLRHTVEVPALSVTVVLWSGLWLTAMATRSRADENQGPAGDSVTAGPTVTYEDDGWPDLSRFMDKPYGFLPIVSPITEPAVGYGVYGGPAFVSKPAGEERAGFGRPNITFAGGAWTENNTWLAMGEDDRQWLNDRLQTILVMGYGTIHLEFHGIGEDALLRDNPLDYSLTPLALLAKAKYRLGQSCFWVGLGYQWAKMVSEFDFPDQFTNLPDIRRDSYIGGVLPLLNYDSRDNIFTPSHGANIELSGGLFSDALGGDAGFQLATLTVIQYVAPSARVTVGLRGDGFASFNDVPFYMYPAISLRGAPAQTYQGEEVAQGELEVRWQFWKRFSAIGFGGYGVAWNDLEQLDNVVDIVTGGGGFRYELARKYDVHAGVDVAWAPDGVAIYVQFGNAWMWK